MTINNKIKNNLTKLNKKTTNIKVDVDSIARVDESSTLAKEEAELIKLRIKAFQQNQIDIRTNEHLIKNVFRNITAFFFLITLTISTIILILLQTGKEISFLGALAISFTFMLTIVICVAIYGVFVFIGINFPTTEKQIEITNNFNKLNKEDKKKIRCNNWKRSFIIILLCVFIATLFIQSFQWGINEIVVAQKQIINSKAIITWKL